MRWFDIEYAVDNGASEYRDKAHVWAEDKNDAEWKLRMFIEENTDSYTCVSEIFMIKPTNVDVFTGLYGSGKSVSNNTGCIHVNGHQDWDFMK